MFGNKFSGEELMKDFHKLMKKTASQDKEAGVSPEDFLVAPSEDVSVESELNGKIADVASYAEDSELKTDEAMCYSNAADDDKSKDDDKKEDDKCEECECDPCECEEDDDKDEKDSEDKDDKDSEDDALDYYVNREAAHVLTELGKMAGRLRRDNKGFAADMVEATAMSIKDELVKEASQKMLVLAGLERMAGDMYKDGDKYAGDVLLATLQELKGRTTK
jgi:hypothetical protein